MKYIITKTILDKFTYYLNEFGSWTGLKDNAKVFTNFDLVEEKVYLLQKHNERDKVGFIEENYFSK